MLNMMRIPLALWQHEIGWCRTNKQTINELKVSVMAKERIPMLQCGCCDPYIIGRDGTALLPQIPIDGGVISCRPIIYGKNMDAI